MNQRLTQVLCDVLDLDPARVGPDLMREEVDQWDSLNHLKVVTAVEEAFDLKLTMQEIESVDGIARLIDLLEAHDRL
ncbi:MAG TPA: acyl carrier protein [Thermomicrobiales bacterium]|nr:acyl carrier protein [Thermomicrobiales bacterium]